MPSGKSPILQSDLMAEGDTNKHILFNDAVLRLEDSVNRALAVDLSAGDVSLTVSQVTNYGVFKASGHTVARTVTIPALVATGVPTNRLMIFWNKGSALITLTHGSGNTVSVDPGGAGIVYADGTDVVSLGGIAGDSGVGVSDEGTLVTAAAKTLNFVGSGVTATGDGAGNLTITVDGVTSFVALSDTPAAYTGAGGQVVAVNAGATGLEFIPAPKPTAAETKTAYESNADTNAFTDAEKTKLTGVEAGATADMTAAEIKTAYESNADTNAFTDAEKTKLSSLESSKFLGTYVSLTALQTAHPAPAQGSFAHVDAGVGSNVVVYIWDNDDAIYVQQGGASTAETAESIKTKYESNADTNAFTDAEKTKLSGVEAGATADQTGAEIVTALDTQLGSATWQGGSTVAVEDEGVQILAAAARLNFTGAGVTVTDALNGEVAIDIPGGGGGSVAIEDEGVEVVAAASRINFTGAGVAVTDATNGEVNVAITGGATSLDGLSDVDTSTVAPTLDQALVWNGSMWVPGDVASSGGGGGGGTVPTFGIAPVVGQYTHTCSFGRPASTFNTNVVSNYVYLHAWFCRKTITVDEIGTYYDRQVIGGQQKLVVYAADPATGHPAGLLVASPEFEPAGAGYASKAISYTFEAGKVYWVGIHTGTAGWNQGGVHGESVPCIPSGTIGLQGNRRTTVRMAATYSNGTPATFTWNGEAESQDAYNIFFRVASVGEDATVGGGGGLTKTTQTAAFSVTDAMLAGNQYVRVNLAAAGDVTVPAGLTGTEPCTFVAEGAGQVTFVPATGVTIRSADAKLKTRVQYSSVTLIPAADVAVDTYDLIGDLAA